MFKKVDKKTVYEIIKKDINKIPPKIVITYETLLKFNEYTKQCKYEIGWLALVKEIEKNKEYLIYDTILPEQKVTGVTTELDENSLVQIGNELLKTDPDKFDDVKCWCHSHVDMAVFASSTDEETFEEYYTNCDYFIRIIVNKKGDMKLDWASIDAEIKFENLDFEVEYPTNIKKEIDFIESKKKARKEEEEKDEKRIEILLGSINKDISSNIKKDIDDNVKNDYKKYTSNTKTTYYGTGYTDYYESFYSNFDDDKAALAYGTNYFGVNEIENPLLDDARWASLDDEMKYDVIQMSYGVDFDELLMYCDNNRDIIKIAQASSPDEIYNIFKNSKSIRRVYFTSSEEEYLKILDDLSTEIYSMIVDYNWSVVSDLYGG